MSDLLCCSSRDDSGLSSSEGPRSRRMMKRRGSGGAGIKAMMVTKASISDKVKPTSMMCEPAVGGALGVNAPKPIVSPTEARVMIILMLRLCFRVDSSRSFPGSFTDCRL